MNKYQYLFKSIIKKITGQKDFCPNCNEPAERATTIDSKYVITRLVECNQCRLLYRTPQDSKEESTAFYQDDYTQGYTTDVPSDDQLKALLNINFEDTERDYNRYIELFKSLGIVSEAKVLDFGCSWGYGTYQFKKAGYQSTGYEVSRPRCRYAKDKLGVEAFYEYNQLGTGYDVFFSSHVLEHVDSVRQVWELAHRVLKPGGLFIAYTPNGSKRYRETNYPNFHKSWGLKHPNLLQDEFVRKLSNGSPFFFSSTPHSGEFIKKWNKTQQVISDSSGWEMLAIIVR